MKNTRRPVTNLHRENHGFTIIEVMVAMVISLVLLLGVINIFMASNTSHTLQNGVARLQENARFALDIMARSISMAGLQTNPAFAAAPDTTDGGGNAHDRISVNYTSPTDCLGNPAAGGIATDSFYLQDDPVTNISNLYCNNQPLVEGIESMQILYGQDNNADGIADSYVAADQVSDWGSSSGGITSIRIAILASTVDDADVTDNQTYQVLNAQAGPFNDNMMRRVFTRTVLLRNYTFTP